MDISEPLTSWCEDKRYKLYPIAFNLSGSWPLTERNCLYLENPNCWLLATFIILLQRTPSNCIWWHHDLHNYNLSRVFAHWNSRRLSLLCLNRGCNLRSSHLQHSSANRNISIQKERSLVELLKCSLPCILYSYHRHEQRCCEEKEQVILAPLRCVIKLVVPGIKGCCLLSVECAIQRLSCDQRNRSVKCRC